MSLKFGWYGSELICECFELEKLALGVSNPDGYFFCMDIPGLENPAVACLSVGISENYSLTFLHGPDAMVRAAELYEGGHEKELLYDTYAMGYVLRPLSEHVIDSKKWIKSTKYKYSGDAALPQIFSAEPGELLRTPNDRETRILLYAVRGMIKGWKYASAFQPDWPEENGVLTLVVSGDVDNPQVIAEIRYSDGRTEVME